MGAQFCNRQMVFATDEIYTTHLQGVKIEIEREKEQVEKAIMIKPTAQDVLNICEQSGH